MPPSPHYRRGYGRIYLDHVLQADQGCDFDILRKVDEPDDDLARRYAGELIDKIK